MDLSLTKDEERFANEVRDWLGSHARRSVAPATTSAGPDSEAELVRAIGDGRLWQEELARGGWVGISWPEEYGGRGATAVEVAIFNSEYARSGAPQPVNRVGINLAAPTLLAHGTPEQCRRFLPPIATAKEIWCQLFSEPGAGSDLASLRTTAERRSGGWVISGHKVWTSYAQFAAFGLCLARSEPASAGPRGLSLFVVDMRGAGVEIRPLVQITGEAEFNEVVLDEVFVADDHLVGEPGRGWAVASTTLAHERGTNFPFKEEVVHEGYLSDLVSEATASGAFDDPEISDGLADSYVALTVLRSHNLRTLSRLARGEEPGAESSWVKLAWSDMTQLMSQTALALEGPAGAISGRWARQWLWSRAASIAGGTSEIQKNIIAERILGLPRETSPGTATPATVPGTSGERRA